MAIPSMDEYDAFFKQLQKAKKIDLESDMPYSDSWMKTPNLYKMCSLCFKVFLTSRADMVKICPVCKKAANEKIKTAKEIAEEKTKHLKPAYTMKHSNLKYINRIGIELEGGWDKTPVGLFPDHSVKVKAPVVGEIASQPGTLEELEDWIHKNYPKYIDNSCGVHIHVSFKDKVNNFLVLMEPKFYDYFKPFMESWAKNEKLPADHAFWTRFKGLNKFCKDEFKPEAQILINNKGTDVRYTQLNYCFAMHGTIENRLFPAFKEPETIVSAMNATVLCYESYLEKNAETLTKVFEEVIFEEQFE